MEVGVRELRADLSKWLKRVQAGEEIVVTDRGRPIARIARTNTRSKLDELIARGLARPALEPVPEELPPLIKAKGTVSDLVRDDDA
jgi:antitoxin (DNA-binding transcriptional repressor) of toxin-antitoxin stability system